MVLCPPSPQSVVQKTRAGRPPADMIRPGHCFPSHHPPPQARSLEAELFCVCSSSSSSISVRSRELVQFEGKRSSSIVPSSVPAVPSG